MHPFQVLAFPGNPKRQSSQKDPANAGVPQGSILGPTPRHILDLSCTHLLNAAPFCENHPKLYFEAKHCCHAWAGAPSCYLELLDKLQQQICRTVGPCFAASLEPLADCGNVTNLSLFYRYYFDRCSSELVQLVPPPFPVGGLLVSLIDCHHSQMLQGCLWQQFLSSHN